MKKIVVVDSKLLAYYFFHRREPAYKIFRKVAELLNDYGIHPNEIGKIVWAMDSNKKGYNKRKSVYPEYKAHRKELTKKKTQAEQARQKEFEKLYQNMESLFKYFGVPIAIGGIEADDVANIIVERFGEDYEIILVSSDRDWSFNFELTKTPKNIKIIHLTRGLITKSNCEDKLEIPSEAALYFQVYAGIAKENVSGIVKLGKKTFMKYWKSVGGNVKKLHEVLKEDVLNGKRGMSLPDDATDFDALIKRNLQILSPILYEDLTEEQKAEFKEQFDPSNHLEDNGTNLAINWESLFKVIPIFPPIVKSYYKVKGAM